MAPRTQVVISGVGLMTHAGEGPDGLEALLGRPAVPEAEEVEEGCAVPVGRIGRIRNHPFSNRYDRFGQVDTFSRYAFIAAGHALDDAAIDAPAAEAEAGGVILGTAYGCQEANWQFDQFSLDPEVGLRGASPMMFKSTVDNAPAGWVSVGYAHRGVNATFVSGPGAGAEAVQSAAWAVVAGRAPHVICGGVERLIPLQIAASIRAGQAPAPFGAEGSALVVVEHPDAAAARGHAPRARLLAWGRLTDGDGGGLGGLLHDAGVAAAAIALVSAGGPADAAAPALAAAGVKADLEIEAERTGYHVSAQGPLALALTATRMSRGEIEGPALVWVPGEQGEALVFVVGRA